MSSVAFVGPQGSGKTSIARLLMEERGYIRIGISDPIKEIAQMAYRDLTKSESFKINTWYGERTLTGREMLQDIGSALRDVDQDFWLRIFRQRYFAAVHAGASVVIDDVRLPREAAYLSNIDPACAIVLVTADPATRAARVGGRLIAGYDETETLWAQVQTDYRIDTRDILAEAAASNLLRWIADEWRK